MFKSTLLALCLGVSSASAAMILGFGAEADYYSPSVSGDFNYKGTATHFSGDDDSGFQLGAFFEHPVPLIPNVRLDYTPSTTFSGSNGHEVSFKQLDITPYYEILDNFVDLDVGVTFRQFSGTVTAGSNQDFNAYIPMGYLGAGVIIPGLPVRFLGQYKYIGYHGHYLQDARVKAIFDLAAGFEAEVGYRHEVLNVDDFLSTTANVTMKGPFFGLAYTF